jgi:hypothetical protein
MPVAEILSTINRTSVNIIYSFLPIYIMGMIDSPVCRRCGTEEETWACVVWEREALVTLITLLTRVPFS